MKSIIHFHISKGKKKYIAEGVELSIVTEANTIEKLLKNISEATNLHIQSIKNPSDFGIIRYPSISVSLELPNRNISYA